MAVAEPFATHGPATASSAATRPGRSPSRCPALSEVLAADCRNSASGPSSGCSERDRRTACSTPRARRPDRPGRHLSQGPLALPWRRSLHDAGRSSVRRPRPRRAARRHAHLLRRQLPRSRPACLTRPGRRPGRAADQLADRRHLDDPPPDRRPRPGKPRLLRRRQPRRRGARLPLHRPEPHRRLRRRTAGAAGADEPAVS